MTPVLREARYTLILLLLCGCVCACTCVPYVLQLPAVGVAAMRATLPRDVLRVVDAKKSVTLTNTIHFTFLILFPQNQLKLQV